MRQKAAWYEFCNVTWCVLVVSLAAQHKSLDCAANNIHKPQHSKVYWVWYYCMYTHMICSKAMMRTGRVAIHVCEASDYYADLAFCQSLCHGWCYWLVQFICAVVSTVRTELSWNKVFDKKKNKKIANRDLLLTGFLYLGGVCCIC